jgi:hypothetical protein
MDAIHVGSIVRVTGRRGDWRVVQEGLTLGTHEPTLYLESLREQWTRHRIVSLAGVYLAPRITLS